MDAAGEHRSGDPEGGSGPVLPAGAAAASPTPGSWSRQFREPATRAQVAFDLIAGILVPLACAVFDPVVFRTGLLGSGVEGRPVLQGWQAFAYPLGAIEIALLAFWLRFGAAGPGAGPVLAGALAAGALLAAAVGIAILPYSLLGIVIFGLGLLGLVPFASAFTYARGAVRALRVRRSPPRRAAALAALGFVLAVMPPAGGEVILIARARAAVRTVISGGEEASRRALAFLDDYGPWVPPSFAGDLYRAADALPAGEEARRERIESACRAILGATFD